MKNLIKIFSLVIIITIVSLQMISVSALPPPPVDENGNPIPYTPLIEIEINASNGTGKYEKKFVEYFDSLCEDDVYEYYYNEIQEVYDTETESTPDYVLVEAYKNYVGYLYDYRMFINGLVFLRKYDYVPYTLGYFVFVPDTQEILTIDEAIRRIDNIETLLIKSGVCRLLGDVNNDGKITIKDVSSIQKKIAGFDIFEDEYTYYTGGMKSHGEYVKGYYSDFNMDDELNIKDATAIQKYIAGYDSYL